MLKASKETTYEGRKMSAKKQVSVNVAIALGVVVVAMIIVLAAVFVSPTTFNLNKAKRNPYLVNIGIGGQDLGPQTPNNPSLHLTGYIVNTGDMAAYNVKLHVVASNVNGAKIIDSYVPIGSGTISGQDFVQVDESISYTGPYIAVGTMTIAPYWVDSP
jgi:hypothetical protein